MNCPTCKNPIITPGPTCEWCGSLILVEQNSNHIDASNDLSKIVEQNSNLSLFYPSKSYNIRFRTNYHPIFVGSYEGFIKTGDT